MMNPEIISERAKNAKKNSREHRFYGDKLVYLKDQLPFEFDLEYVLDTIEKLIPSYLVENIDIIYVGNFKTLGDKETPFNAKYKDGAIYVTNEQENENDMLDDIVHEIAHAVEERYNNDIYSDMQLENEFRGKRRTLYHYLEQEGFEPSMEQIENVEYDKDFDYYLYNIVEYPTLTSLTTGLFYSPYAITSINEYFANGFENYFLRDRDYLKKISPVLYDRVNKLTEENI